MKKLICVVACVMVPLAACTPVDESSSEAPERFLTTLPEGVVERAAPGQDLTAVKIDPIDGCLVYRHVGPVETTFIPLRARNGGPICTRMPETA